MKRIYTILQMAALLIVTAIIIAGFSGFGDKPQENLGNEIKKDSPIAKFISEKKAISRFDDVELFKLKNDKNLENKLNSFAKSYILLEIKPKNLNQILDAPKENISLKIPVAEGYNYDLELTRVSVRTSDFKMFSLGKNTNEQKFSDEGLHYRGIVKGNNNSWAAISIFKDNVMGLIATETGNYVLGAIKIENKNFTGNYVLYNDEDLLKLNSFKCGVDEKEDQFVRNYKNPQANQNNFDGARSIDTVGIYFEADYQMYVDNNFNQNELANFIYGAFNQVATIYQNESLPIKISGIGYWAQPDPYINDTDAYDILTKFGNNKKDNFNGDLAQLLSTGHNNALGGIAWINVLCSPYNSQDYSGRFSFCNIEDNYHPYPTYSWTVMVVAHEMGHNFGSYHTHACHWPTGFGIGPIDTCVILPENSTYFGGCVPVYPQNGCFRPKLGSIMSYCHFCEFSGGGINLAGGFTQMPGDTIRRWYYAASCLHYETNSSELPVTYNLLQNYPNPFNPSTNIKYALPEEGFVTLTLYDITGREVVRLIENKFFNAGIYSYLLDANLHKMSSGVYLYKISVSRDAKNIYSEIKKMVLIK
jgi:hypothetical protein